MWRIPWQFGRLGPEFLQNASKALQPAAGWGVPILPVVVSAIIETYGYNLSGQRGAIAIAARPFGDPIKGYHGEPRGTDRSQILLQGKRIRVGWSAGCACETPGLPGVIVED